MLKTRLATTTALTKGSIAEPIATTSLAVVSLRATTVDIFDLGATLTMAGGVAAQAPNEINGTTGNDEGLFGTTENDRIYGFAGNDYLYGLAGTDVLDGGAGADVMAGGTGDDYYRVDNVGDVVWEWGGQGFDTVTASIDYTMPAGIEVLRLEGGSADQGIGNELNNSIHANEKTGADCLLDGGAGNDTLYGSYGDDRLIGGTGNDTLIGWQGADVMQGGEGDDHYFVHQAGDLVVENFGQGTDTVSAYISYTLTGAVENLYLRDDAPLFDLAINGTGNELDNVIHGNKAANVITGGGGRDTMFGREGADTFKFTSITDAPALGAGLCDHIADFSETQGDKIDLSAIDANVLIGGDQAFTPIGVNVAFNGVAGALRFNGGLLEGDVNGDRVADFQIQLDVAGVSAAGLVL